MFRRQFNFFKPQGPTSASVVYGRLLGYVKPFKFAFILAILGNILFGAVDGGLVKLFEPLLNKGFVEQDRHFIQWIPFIIIGVFFLRGLASFLSTYCMGWVARNVVMNFRQQMFAHLIKLPCSYYDNTTSGELLSKITYNVEQVAEASSDAFSVLIRETCTALFLLAVMFSVSWKLTCLFFVTVPIMVVLMHVISNRMRDISTKIQNSMGGVTHVAEEVIEGQKVVKAFGGQAYEQAHFEKTTENNRVQEMKLIVASALSIPFIQIIGACALAATIYLATLSPSNPAHTAITPGGFTALIGAMFALLKPIKQLTKVNTNIQKGIAGASSIFEFLDQACEINSGHFTCDAVNGNIAFKDVSFQYVVGEKEPPSREVLSQVSFEIQAGETVAIVGRSGAGKSTLVNLLPRFYEYSGVITLDGRDIKTFDLNNLRQHFAMVSQHVTLFNDTVAQNIAYGAKDVTLDQIRQAAQLAYVDEFIHLLPQGLDTVVGENGVRLSGGQRQRIALARAILKQAPILILDEATSALDTESERKIQQALDNLMSKSTTLVIAHRLSTVESADRILVVDKGKIVEMGTHHELMNIQGLYASLRKMQFQSVA